MLATSLNGFTAQSTVSTSRAWRYLAQMLMVLALCAASLSANAIEVGDKLVINDLKTIDGQTLTSEDLKDKYLVVQVWATWCPYCHRQNINLIELVNRTQGLPIQVIALSIDRKAGAVPPYVEKHAINFPVAMMTPELDKAIGKRQGVPELYVIDPEGYVVQKDYGEMVDLDVWDLIDYVKPAEPS
ncbi:MAG TPA: TlpA disulfide reductase family protein [Orrella sp.]